jgi:hypothetical protein
MNYQERTVVAFNAGIAAAGYKLPMRLEVIDWGT